MARELVIVESPAKARTIGKILGDGYVIKASLGHIRDLPKKSLGVDVKNDFRPQYEVVLGRRKVVDEIREAAEKAPAVYLATDPDREGEAISWHLVQAAKLKGKPVKRVVFHEITGDAVKEAFRHPREIDMHLVSAQQARRILDRLVGYLLSPLLWKKVMRGLSAGRVQSVALRLVVDREREIASFVPQEYWTIEVELRKKEGKPTFTATLIGPLKGGKLALSTGEEAARVAKLLDRARYSVLEVKRRDALRQPVPPFITSTLQQEAWRKLRFTAKKTMALAQQLYEGLSLGPEGPVGLITYMRTDSPRVAAPAVAEARAYIERAFGKAFLPHAPRHFSKKVKGAQEAHEAIRPTSVEREPRKVKAYLNKDQFLLYELIWKRLVASQMAAAVFDTTTVDIEAEGAKGEGKYLLRAGASVLKFPGFLTLYQESRDEPNEDRKASPLPSLSPGEALEKVRVTPLQHFTQPLPRYSEASLIKALEEKGIGRPSTYATILATIQERGYVVKQDGHLQPVKLGEVVNDLLCQSFPQIVDVEFTARWEEKLDDISQGEREWVPQIREFYEPFSRDLEQAFSHLQRLKLEEPSEEVCPTCGRPMVVKMSRFGKFLSCSGYPECKEKKPYLDKIGVACPQCGNDLVKRRGKKGLYFYGCAGYPACNFALNRLPLPSPCPECGGLMVAQGREKARCLKCNYQGEKEEPAPVGE